MRSLALPALAGTLLLASCHDKPKPPEAPLSKDAAFDFSHSRKSDLPTDRMLIGTGYNTAPGDEKGDCVVRGALETASGGPGNRTRYQIHEVSNLSDFRKTMNLTASGSLGWGIFSGSVSADYYSAGRFTQYNSFLIIEVDVLNPAESLSQSHLTPDALTRAREGSLPFIDACGDQFVHKRQTGGQLTVIVQFSSATSEEQSRISTDVHAAISAFIISGQTDVSFNQTMDKLSQYA